MKRYYPISLDLENQKVVIIGGGKVAERKVRKLLPFGALIEIVSPEVTKALAKMVVLKKVVLNKRRYRRQFIKNARLIFAATDDQEVNKQVLEDARREKILINRVDVSCDCNFISPAIVKKKEFILAISTNARNPALSKKLRQRLEKVL